LGTDEISLEDFSLVGFSARSLSLAARAGPEARHEKTRSRQKRERAASRLQNWLHKGHSRPGCINGFVSGHDFSRAAKTVKNLGL
jgi:hypothetical protein